MAAGLSRLVAPLGFTPVAITHYSGCESGGLLGIATPLPDCCCWFRLPQRLAPILSAFAMFCIGVLSAMAR